jgi:NAD(P)-dependent dehydrogenase (short-subunit alcohol dehydrogenase family)
MPENKNRKIALITGGSRGIGAALVKKTSFSKLFCLF